MLKLSVLLKSYLHQKLFNTLYLESKSDTHISREESEKCLSASLLIYT